VYEKPYTLSFLSVFHYIDNFQRKYTIGIIFADVFSVVFDYYFNQVFFDGNGGELALQRQGVGTNPFSLVNQGVYGETMIKT
jgi:hypothetical protein